MSRLPIPLPAHVVEADRDYEALAQVFSRIYAETKNIADALRVYEAVKDRGTVDIGAVDLNEIVAEVAHHHGIEPGLILGRDTSAAVSRARFECWWLMHKRGLTVVAIAAAWRRNHSVVVRGLRVIERRMDAETRARLGWTLAKFQWPAREAA